MSILPSVVAKVTATREDLEKRASDRRKARIEEQLLLKGPVNREAPVTKSGKPLLGELKSSDSMVKIGGLMGVDTTYRLARLTEETNSILRKILAKIAPSTDESPDLQDLADNM